MVNNNERLIVDITVYDTINKNEDTNSYQISLDQYERIMKIIDENN